MALTDKYYLKAKIKANYSGFLRDDISGSKQTRYQLRDLLNAEITNLARTEEYDPKYLVIGDDYIHFQDLHGVLAEREKENIGENAWYWIRLLVHSEITHCFSAGLLLPDLPPSLGTQRQRGIHRPRLGLVSPLFRHHLDKLDPRVGCRFLARHAENVVAGLDTVNILIGEKIPPGAFISR